MKKIYVAFAALLMSLGLNAQTTLDLSTVDAAYKTTVDGAEVIDAAVAAAQIAAPAVSFANPLLGQVFTEAEISFDAKNYGDVKVLGALLSVYDAALGRMYFTNGSYLGYNIGNEDWFDANLVNYAIGTDFLGKDAWKNVKIQFTATSTAVLIDNELAFNESSTDVTIAKGTGYTGSASMVTFLQNAASIVVGTGSWWSDNIDSTTMTYWDTQATYIKNITVTPNFSTVEPTAIGDITAEGAEVVSEEFYNLSGVLVGVDFDALEPNIYIKKVVYSNGVVESTKINKSNY